MNNLTWMPRSIAAVETKVVVRGRLATLRIFHDDISLTWHWSLGTEDWCHGHGSFTGAGISDQKAMELIAKDARDLGAEF